MIQNRSIPPSSVIPELAYDDVDAAADWLSEAFGFRVRLRIGNHRVQMRFGDGAIVATDGGRATGDDQPTETAVMTHSVLVRVGDADRHYEQARRAGARIINPPTDHPYGERQYTAEDIGGHRWKFSQSIADVDPASWGGTSVDLD
ncbi:MAG TPA: VOC family protein [Candidatus Limnocylindrales bacterium]|nr:VOC family protein [Candidatus Limnocylindrales bacterium]